MARVGQVDPKYKELNDAKESLQRELARQISSEHGGEYLMQRIERYVAAMIAVHG